ncbi:MAG: bifunctional phosphopantothenoylcysteine decarboxylase/phosphopantothenate--cysteine ligase CoaBC [Acidobacteriota bacterium]|jgi:phosphopantothenoylcysteine decarboxylase/phosphopantothenate--cysteine ligase
MSSVVVLGISGGIAAFRAAELARALVKEGCEVFPILTRNAARFVSPYTLSILTGHAAQVSLWRGQGAAVDHIELARRADLLVLAPATANLLAKLAAGVADDALTTYALAHRRGVVLAPAMNTFMWRHPATQAAVEVLAQRGAVVVAPEVGALACGDVGEGRLASLERILAAALAVLPRRGPLAGLRLLITAGATREPLDAVRVLTNRSSGRMGLALVSAARRLGADVRLLAGGAMAVPHWVECDRFESAAELAERLAERAGEVDCVLHAAAVADFRPAHPVAGKMDRRGGPLTVELEPVPDLAAGMARPQGRPYLVIFAANAAHELGERAHAKLVDKGADAVVANPIDEPGAGMESSSNRALLLSRRGIRREFPLQDKESLATELLLTLAPELLGGR